MLIIRSKNHDAEFNIASEEYLFNCKQDNIFLLYQNNKAIIVGRKQNTIAEINQEYIQENQIKVVRRMSGGGAVFHDIGNLNFCFIIRNVDTFESDFSRYTQPIIEVLQSLGVNARLEGRNDLTIDGKKFSGNAKYFRGNTLLQHGTLLFDSNISDVTKALNVDPSKFNDKSVKSVRSRITNITEHLKTPVSMETFEDLIIKNILSLYQDADYYEYTDKDLEAIETLKKDKYANWEWNYGKSPEYNFHKKHRCPGGSIEVMMTIRKGIIEDFKLYGDFFAITDTDSFEKSFIGKTHQYHELNEHMMQLTVKEIFMNISREDILEALF